MADWAKDGLQCLPASIQAGGGQHQVGPQDLTVTQAKQG